MHKQPEDIVAACRIAYINMKVWTMHAPFNSIQLEVTERAYQELSMNAEDLPRECNVRG